MDGGPVFGVVRGKGGSVRSDGHESNGRRRSSQVMARWVSVDRAARMLDVSVRTVARMEAAHVFGEGNSAVIKLPGSSSGVLRIRVRAVNALMEQFAEQREADRQAMASRTLQAHENRQVSRGAAFLANSGSGRFLDMSQRSDLVPGVKEGVDCG